MKKTINRKGRKVRAGRPKGVLNGCGKPSADGMRNGRSERMSGMKMVDDYTLEWWVLGTPGTFCGVPCNHYVTFDDSDSLNGHYAETEILREATTFNTKEDALQELATSFIQNDLEWDYGEIIPLKITETLVVEAEQ